MTATTAFASGMSVLDGGISTSVIGLTEVGIRAAANRYMTTRTGYLLGTSQSIDAVDAMIQDENAHIAVFASLGIVWCGSTYTIDSIDCYDTVGIVTVSETVEYLMDGALKEELVLHELKVYPVEDGLPIVARDAYLEEFSNFNSCSFVVESGIPMETMAGGSKHCIVRIAQFEIGTEEYGTDMTKYGAWYGLNGNPWCAMFVAWCADQANVSTSVIPCTASVPTMKNFYSQRGTFYLSASQGGSTAPQVGDLFFERGCL